MKALEYLIVHCSDTPTGRDVKPNDIFLWHMAPKLLQSGEYLFMGKKYTKDGLKKVGIPQHTGFSVCPVRPDGTVITGNGWSQIGYSDMIDIYGNLINLIPYTFDTVVSEFEITNGAVGHNRNSRHIVLVGGGPAGIGPIEDVMNTKQIAALTAYVRMVREISPDIKIIGHNDISTKTCPNFKVDLFLKKYL